MRPHSTLRAIGVADGIVVRRALGQDGEIGELREIELLFTAREYRDTRHNAGFQLAERLAREWGAAWRTEKKFFAELAETTRSGRRMRTRRRSASDA